MTKELFPGPFDLLPPIFRDCTDDVTGVTRNLCLSYPQPVDNHVVATDGRICVRMLATPEIIAALPDIAPKTFPAKTTREIIGNRSLWHIEPIPLPSLDHLERCKHCEGKGTRPEHKCVCDTWDADEMACRGRGMIPAGECWECDGTGIRNAFQQFVELRKDVKLSAYYLGILAKHGATLYLPVTPNTHESTTPAYFTIEGGVEGVLMPAAVDKPEKAKTGATA